MAEDRHISDTGYLVHHLAHAIINQAGNREALPFAEVDLRLGSTRTDRRNEESLNRERIREIERADFRLHFEVDHSIGIDGWCKHQPHTKRTKLDCDSGRRLAARTCR